MTVMSFNSDPQRAQINASTSYTFAIRLAHVERQTRSGDRQRLVWCWFGRQLLGVGVLPGCRGEACDMGQALPASLASRGVQPIVVHVTYAPRRNELSQTG
jgi:hypothetical protein